LEKGNHPVLKQSFLLFAGTLIFASAGYAQSNDVAVTFGATFSPSVSGTPICEALPVCPTGPVSHSVEQGFSFVGAYSHRLINLKAASLHLELPVMFAPSRKAETALFNPDFSSFYFTPSVKLKLLPDSGISPFVSAGGGVAHFSEGSTSNNKGAFQVGGGVDFKTRLPLLGFRFEVRDFITGIPGTPSFAGVSSDHLQSIFVGGGITLHF
jgi:hypothetical protein